MQKIVIQPVNYRKLDELYNLSTSLGRVAESYKFSNTPISGELSYIVKKLDKQISKAENEASKRIIQWKELLFKYYKMTLTSSGNGYNYEKVFYIYPYDVITENSTLWVLQVDANRDYANYNGGVKDCSITVDRDWNYDIELEEITKEEFEEHAINTVKHVIERRLKKINKQ